MEYLSDESAGMRIFYPVQLSSLRDLIVRFFPGSRPVIGHLFGGCFNYVFTLTFRKSQFVWRTPRRSRSHVGTCVAILKRIHGQIGVPTPRVIKCHTTWMILDRLVGVDMTHDVYATLTDGQACNIARQIAIVLASIHAITFNGCGHLICNSSRQLVVAKPIMGTQNSVDAVFDASYQAPRDLRTFLIERLQLIACHAERAIEANRWSMFDLFAAVFCPYLIQAVGIIVNDTDPSRGVLYHPDLRPHNFLIQLPSKYQSQCRHSNCKRPNCKFRHTNQVGDAQITGLLDWDDCQSLPVELAYRVPTWLWSETNNEFESSFYLGHRPNTPPAPNRHKTREVFLSEMERRIPRFVEIAQRSFDSGISALGCIARVGFPNQYVAGLARKVLRRPNIDLEDIAQRVFTKRKLQLEKALGGF